MAMKTSYSKHEYKAAKSFLADAVVVKQYEDPTQRNTTYMKPDGHVWLENESLLEYPEDYYRLIMLTAWCVDKSLMENDCQGCIYINNCKYRMAVAS